MCRCHGSFCIFCGTTTTTNNNNNNNTNTHLHAPTPTYTHLHTTYHLPPTACRLPPTTNQPPTTNHHLEPLLAQTSNTMKSDRSTNKLFGVNAGKIFLILFGFPSIVGLHFLANHFLSFFLHRFFKSFSCWPQRDKQRPEDARNFLNSREPPEPLSDRRLGQAVRMLQLVAWTSGREEVRSSGRRCFS